MRRVLSAPLDRALDDPRHLRFEIRATAFCHQMVRSIVGTLVDVGIGKARRATSAASSSRRDRDTAGQVAPPYGLGAVGGRLPAGTA